MRKFRLKLNCLFSCSFVELTQYLQLRNYANVQAAEETVCFTYRYVSTVRMLILKQGMRISVDAVHLSVELSLWIIARCVHSKLCFIGFSKGQRA